MILHAVFQCMNHLESLGILSEEELEEVSCESDSSPPLPFVPLKPEGGAQITRRCGCSGWSRPSSARSG